jgi:transcriptional regulator with XRE-family HTH domain
MDEITIESFQELKPGIGDRFKRFRYLAKKTQQEIAEAIKEPVSSVIDIEAGKNPPGIPLLHCLYHRYKLNLNWLLFGEGNVFIHGGFYD